MLCLPCLGKGEFPEKRTCPRCIGRGELPDARLNNPMCAYCVGTGRDPFKKGKLCTICDGWGRLPDKEPSSPAKDSASNGRQRQQPTASEPRRSDPLIGVMRDMVGDVEVCDPSLSADSLERLRLLRHCDMIRVLTHDVDADLIPRIREFTRELPRYLFRKYGGREIRDRYLLTPSEIIFVGPRTEGSNGVPRAVIRVPAELAGEMIQDVRLGFNRLWGAGSRLG